MSLTAVVLSFSELGAASHPHPVFSSTSFSSVTSQSQFFWIHLPDHSLHCATHSQALLRNFGAQPWWWRQALPLLIRGHWTKKSGNEQMKERGQRERVLSEATEYLNTSWGISWILVGQGCKTPSLLLSIYFRSLKHACLQTSWKLFGEEACLLCVP